MTARSDPVAQLADELDEVLFARPRDLDQAVAVLERAAAACRSDPRIGDPVIVPTGPYAIRVHAADSDRLPNKGMHGYDPHTMPQMRAIFYAEGPDIRPGVKLKLFENVNVYPWLAEILGLDAPPNDGSAAILDPALISAH